MPPFDKIPAGSPLSALRVDWVNRISDMLRWWLQQGFQTGAGDMIRSQPDVCIFDINNNSGSAQPWCGVLGIDSWAIGPGTDLDGFRRKPILQGVTPATPTHVGKWAVLLDACPAGGMCQCAVAGVVPVQVYVNATTDQYCDVTAAQTVSGTTVYLSTGQSGAEILLLDPSATAGGIFWAIVRVGFASGVVPFELYDDLAPWYSNLAGTMTPSAWQLKGDFSRNTDLPKVTLHSDVLSNGRAFGSNHAAGWTGARVWCTKDANGNYQIVALQPLAKLIKGTAAASFGIADASFGPIVLNNPIVLDGGQAPFLFGGTVTVYNPNHRIGAAGNTVYARWSENVPGAATSGASWPAYEIEQSQPLAAIIEGTANAAGSAGTSPLVITVLSSMQPDGGPTLPAAGTGIAVVPLHNERWGSGSNVVAVWNQNLSQYEAIYVQQQASVLKGTLTVSGSTVTMVGSGYSGGAAVLQPNDGVLPPNPITITNPEDIELVPAGSTQQQTGIAVWSEASGAYELVSAFPPPAKLLSATMPSDCTSGSFTLSGAAVVQPDFGIPPIFPITVNAGYNTLHAGELVYITADHSGSGWSVLCGTGVVQLVVTGVNFAAQTVTTRSIQGHWLNDGS
jgi:hypothetical protein